MPLENPKKKTHKVHMQINQSKYLKNMFIRDFVFKKQGKHPFKKDF